MQPQRSFIDRLMGVSKIDNAANPDSALNKNIRNSKPGPITKQSDQMRQHLEYVRRNSSNFGGKGWGP